MNERTIYDSLLNKKAKLAVIGLGYVGLPVAVALAHKFDSVVGFDISVPRISALKKHQDWNCS